MLPKNIKANSIGKVIENDVSFNYPGSKRRYHMMSRDWISNEIFRRVEPEGRTMGEVLRELRRMYQIDIVCGAQEEELRQMLPWQYISSWRTFKNMWHGPYKCPSYFRLRDIQSYIKNSNERKEKDSMFHSVQGKNGDY